MNETRNAPAENIMGTAAVPGLILRTGIPLMLSLLLNSLYNVVDSVFVSRVCEDALTAVSLCSPVQLLMGALGCGVAVGLNAAVSKSLGEKDRAEVTRTASAAMFLGLCAYVLIALVCVLGAEPYMRWQAGGSALIEAYGVDYLRVVMLFSLGQMCQWVMDRFLIATGKSSMFLITLASASITNLILDPIFIFGWLGLPAMGTKGAAIATVAGQFVGALAGIYINLRHNTEIPLRFTLRPKGRCLVRILRVGVPTAVMQGVVSIMGIFMNTILSAFSSTAVAVYGVCNKIQSLVTVGMHGVNNGLIPIVAYNYGARKKQRIALSIRWALIDSLLIYAVFFAALEAFPGSILRLFDASETMLSIGEPAIRLLAVSWFLATPCAVLSSVFQALGLGGYSMYLTLLRQVALPMLFVWLLAGLGNLPLLWASFSAAELLALPLGLWLFKRTKRNVLLPLDAPQ